MTNIRRPLSLALVAFAATGAAAVPVSRAFSGSAPADGRTLADYCLVVGPIYYQDRPVYPGGLYCVPAPGA